MTMPSVPDNDWMPLRVARARVSALLAQSSFMPGNEEILIKIDPGDVDNVQGRLAAMAGLPTAISVSSETARQLTSGFVGTNGVLVPTEFFKFPDSLIRDLTQERKRIPDAIMCSASVGISGIPGSAIIDVTIDTSHATNLKLEKLSKKISSAVGARVRIIPGQLAHHHGIDGSDSAGAGRWICKAHRRMRPGIRISTREATSTLTCVIEEGKKLYGIGAGHALPIGEVVYQPVASGNPIGIVTHSSGNPTNRANFDYDVSVITLNDGLNSSNEILDGELQLQIWPGEISVGQPVVFLGAGSKSFRHDIKTGTVDTDVGMLTADNKIVYYRNQVSMIGLDDGVVSRRGDSGGPVIIEHDAALFICGMVVGGGINRAASRKPRSYFTPIGPILDFAKRSLIGNASK